ncbi:MAG: hypothetical protein J6J82_02800 [Alphaproteobacteria bacterium]|nr:hypothetical protein [Alphaproteobacteria bacterium]
MHIIVTFLTAFFVLPVWAAIPSTNYVNEAIETRVGVSADTKQTLAGEYTVTGSFKVPTQPLPSPE